MAREVETVEVETVRDSMRQTNRKVVVKVKIFYHGRPDVNEKVKFIIDSKVAKSLVREEKWQKLRNPANGTKKFTSIKIKHDLEGTA